MTRGPRDPAAAPDVGVSKSVDPMDEWDPADAEMLRGLFLDEAEGHLQRLQTAYAALTDAAASATFEPGDNVDALFRALHTLKGAAGSVGHDAVAAAAHELEDLCAEIRTGQLYPTPGIIERMGEDLARLEALLEGARQMPLGRSSNRALPSPAPAQRRATAASAERRVAGDRRTAIDGGAIEAVSDHVGDLVILRTRMERRLGDLVAVKRELSAGRQSMRRALASISLSLANMTTRTVHDRQARRALARLTDLELEVATSLSHLDRAGHGLQADVEAVRRTTSALDANLRSLRLVTFNWLFRRLQLALDELQTSTRTPVTLMTEGGDLELDRSMPEQLFEPLLHLLRNAIIHGVESPEERARSGKPSEGHLRLTARMEGDFVFISFSDDGRGIDREGVRLALVKRQVWPADEPLSDERLLQALFEPGFSTRPSADAMAGRGMGLNIVQTSVEKLGGTVTCEFTAGGGTAFTLCVPLASAITQALLIKLAGQVYALPLAHVVAALPPLHDTNQGLLGTELTLASGATLPVLRLQGVLGLETPPDHRLSLLHVKFADRDFVITCDRIIGPRTVVVRPLGAILSLLPLFSGATVSGAGKVQLVLDVAALASLAHRNERQGASVPVRRGALRVLVVDDSRLAREAATRALATIGVQTLTAEDGWEAWELLNERRVDAVVTDLEMPRVDGFALISRIRKDPTLKRLPIVVLSSRTSAGTHERARRLGATAIVVKAPQRQALLKTLQKLLMEARAGF